MALQLLSGIRPLTRASALRDALAGVTLASMNIPQLLGYARIAGMPAVAGLYTGFLPLIAFALFGSSRHLVVAADSATATILADKLSGMAAPGGGAYMLLAGAVTLLTAALLLLARLFRLGFLADFLSRTVLAGFLAGVGVQVSIAMLSDMLGLNLAPSHTLEQIGQVAGHLASTQWPTLAISALVVATILGFRAYKPAWPVPLAVVVAAIAASDLGNFAGHGIAVIGPIASGLPTLHLPRIGWRELPDLLTISASCFAVIIAQSAATSRTYAERYGESADENANLLGLAAANAAAALSGTFVVNGSLTQTAMAEQAGARSQFAQIVFAALIVVVLLFLSRWLQYLPHCVLASIVFTIAVGMIKPGTLHAILRESPGEFALALTTALAVIAAGVEDGILLAVALSLFRHVRHSYRPHTMVLAPDAAGRWQPEPTRPGLMTAPGLIVYRFGADLFYANDHRFVDEIRQLVEQAPEPVRWIVIDAGAITDIDYSAGRSMCELCADLAARKVGIVLARVNAYLRADMDRHLITPVIGARNIYSTLHEALEAVHPQAPQPD